LTGYGVPGNRKLPYAHVQGFEYGTDTPTNIEKLYPPQNVFAENAYMVTDYKLDAIENFVFLKFFQNFYKF